MDMEVLVTVCDVNALVGSVQSSWIGPMRPEKENQNGRQLHQTLEEFDQMWASSLVVARTQSEIVLDSGDFTDLKLVFARVRLRGVRADLLRKPRVCNARTAVEGGEIIEKFREELARGPEIPKWVGIDTHAELLANWLRIKSVEYFPVPIRQPRKPWIAKRTFAFIARKQPMFGELSALNGELKRTLFRGWVVWSSREQAMRMTTGGNCLVSCRRLRVAQLRRSVGCFALRIRKMVKEDLCVKHVSFVGRGSEGGSKVGPVIVIFHCQALQVQVKPISSVCFLGGWKASKLLSGRAEQVAETSCGSVWRLGSYRGSVCPDRLCGGGGGSGHDG